MNLLPAIENELRYIPIQDLDFMHVFQSSQLNDIQRFNNKIRKKCHEKEELNLILIFFSVR